MKKYRIRDSRSVEWDVIVSGPTGIGYHTPGKDVTERPRIWIARFTRAGREAPIEVDLHIDESDLSELRAVLEREPEWQYEG